MTQLPPRQKGTRRSTAVFQRRLLRKVARLGFNKVRTSIPSQTLRKALTVLYDQPGEDTWSARLYIPHYWAVYYHDGRKSQHKSNRKQRGGYFVFYVDPKDDPRTRGKIPVRASEVRRLTKEEFYADLQDNFRRQQRGLPAKMIVVNFLGPASSHPFFAQLHFLRETSEMVQKEFAKWLLPQIPTDKDVAVAVLEF